MQADRKGMQQLIEDCKAGKIDLILTKSIARFARNIVDCLSVIEMDGYVSVGMLTGKTVPDTGLD